MFSGFETIDSGSFAFTVWGSLAWEEVAGFCQDPRAGPGGEESAAGQVRPYLEKLDSNAGKHELQEGGDQHDVPDGADGHKHALHHMLERQEHVLGAGLAPLHPTTLGTLGIQDSASLQT